MAIFYWHPVCLCSIFVVAFIAVHDVNASALTFPHHQSPTDNPTVAHFDRLFRPLTFSAQQPIRPSDEERRTALSSSAGASSSGLSEFLTMPDDVNPRAGSSSSSSSDNSSPLTFDSGVSTLSSGPASAGSPTLLPFFGPRPTWERPIADAQNRVTPASPTPGAPNYARATGLSSDGLFISDSDARKMMKHFPDGFDTLPVHVEKPNTDLQFCKSLLVYAVTSWNNKVYPRFRECEYSISLLSPSLTFPVHAPLRDTDAYVSKIRFILPFVSRLELAGSDFVLRPGGMDSPMHYGTTDGVRFSIHFFTVFGSEKLQKCAPTLQKLLDQKKLHLFLSYIPKTGKLYFQYRDAKKSLFSTEPRKRRSAGSVQILDAIGTIGHYEKPPHPFLERIRGMLKLRGQNQVLPLSIPDIRVATDELEGIPSAVHFARQLLVATTAVLTGHTTPDLYPLEHQHVMTKKESTFLVWLQGAHPFRDASDTPYTNQRFVAVYFSSFDLPHRYLTLYTEGPNPSIFKVVYKRSVWVPPILRHSRRVVLSQPLQLTINGKRVYLSLV